jgi:hypothetical protein
MAVHLLAPHLDEAGRRAGLAQVRADAASLFGAGATAEEDAADGVTADVAAMDWPAMTAAAAQSPDPHRIKLVEACLRAYQATGAPVCAVAAERVLT